MFWGGVGGVLCKYISQKGVCDCWVKNRVGSGILSKWDPIWAKWDPSGNLYEKWVKCSRIGKKLNHYPVTMLFKTHFQWNLSLFKRIVGPGTVKGWQYKITLNHLQTLQCRVQLFKRSQLVTLLQVLEPVEGPNSAGSCVFPRDNVRLPLTIIAIIHSVLVPMPALTTCWAPEVLLKAVQCQVSVN